MPGMKSFMYPVMVSSATAAHWAVIMAGSNTYSNYRHQADSCHAYQIMKQNGIPESNIIHLAYDDIANDEQNPFPGKIFNKPTPKGVPGKDVYAGCKIDYRGKQVNAANFLKVMSGDKTADGPVLQSTAEDHVFVYYVDHGGPGILGVPNGAGNTIHASDLNKALETLHSNGGYKELLFYLEACESGSIFNNLLKAPNVKAVTAANPKESSWGWYCSGSQMGGDLVDGKAIGSCLGDEFSVRWMEDTDAANMQMETVGQQFSKVKAAVNKSHVQEYGISTLDSEPIGNFQGTFGELAAATTSAHIEGDGVDSRQVEVHQAYASVLRAETAAARKTAEKQLAAILARRRAADVKFAKIASEACMGDESKAEDMLEGPVEAITNVACHKAAVTSFEEYCGPFDDYSMRYSRLFANLCESRIEENMVVAAIKKGCGVEVVV